MKMSTSHARSAHRAVLQSQPLTCYLAGAIGSAAFLGAPQTKAAVTAVSFGFGPEFTSLDGAGNFSVGPGFGTIYGYSSASYLFLGKLGSDVFLPSGFSGRIQFLAPGTVVGASGAALGRGYFQNDFAASRDLTTDELNQNIGFKTSTNNWGWANVSWTETTKTLSINSAYVESLANTAITVGDVGAVPEPSRMLLALAGLGGVALRRRRKHAV